MNKVYIDAQTALHDVFDGAVILAGGFGLSGNPENCIRELARRMGFTETAPYYANPAPDTRFFEFHLPPSLETASPCSS